MKTKQITFKTITRQEYEEIKKEIISLFDYAKVRRNKQAYALGGFNIIPKNYEKGLSSEQIDELCDYLKKKNIDTGSLDILNDEIYENDEEEFAGTKKNYLFFKDGINFLMRIGDDL